MTEVVNVLKNIAVALFGGTVGSGDSAVTTEGAIPIFFEWLTGPTVLPFFLIGVGVALLLLAVRVVKGIFWGV